VINGTHRDTGSIPQHWSECGCPKKVVEEYQGITSEFVHLATNGNKFGFNVHVPKHEIKEVK